MIDVRELALRTEQATVGQPFNGTRRAFKRSTSTVVQRNRGVRMDYAGDEWCSGAWYVTRDAQSSGLSS